MKKQFAMLTLMFLIVNSFGQNLSDQAAVLQKCIDLKDIQNYLPLDADGTPAAMRIMQHAVTFPRDLEISKSGKQVKFLSKDQITARRFSASINLNLPVVLQKFVLTFIATGILLLILKSRQ
jgi:hypothetical protein